MTVSPALRLVTEEIAATVIESFGSMTKNVKLFTIIFVALRDPLLYVAVALMGIDAPLTLADTSVATNDTETLIVFPMPTVFDVYQLTHVPKLTCNEAFAVLVI